MTLPEARAEQQEVVFGYLTCWSRASPRSRSQLRYQVHNSQEGHPLQIVDRDDQVVVQFAEYPLFTVRWVRSIDDLKRIDSAAQRWEQREKV